MQGAEALDSKFFNMAMHYDTIEAVVVIRKVIMNTITTIIPLYDDSIYREEYTVKLSGESVTPESIMLSLETADMISGLDITSNHVMFHPLPFDAFACLVKSGIIPKKIEEFDYEQLSFHVNKKGVAPEQFHDIGLSENDELNGYGLLDFFMQFIGYSITDFSYEVIEVKRYKFDKGKYIQYS